MLKVAELFWSIQMEGQHTGLPAIFIRLAECNLSCPFCDTDYSVKLELDEKDIIKHISQYNCNTVVITGGEPLLQDLEELLWQLHSRNYNIHLETNGTIEIDLTWKRFDWVTCSPKTKICDLQIDGYQIDEWKLVVDENSLLQDIKKKVEEIIMYSNTDIYLQPCWYKDDLKRTDLSIQNTIKLVKELYPCKLSIQGQKFIHIQ